jgi:DNA gyrase subunit B
LYIAQPPLFRIQSGKEVFYAFSDQEKDKIIASLQASKASKSKSKNVSSEADADIADQEQEGGEKIKGITIQRYKGLGEMNPQQLWETTMNPATRILKKVTIEDAQEADRLFDILMGEKVEPRKHFIQSRAATVKNLDI